MNVSERNENKFGISWAVDHWRKIKEERFFFILMKCEMCLRLRVIRAV